MSETIDKAAFRRWFFLRAATRRALGYQAWRAHLAGKLSHPRYLDLVHECACWGIRADLPDYQAPPGGMEVYAVSEREEPDNLARIDHPTPEQIRVTREAFQHSMDDAAVLAGVQRGQWVRWETGQAKMRPEEADRYVLTALLEQRGEAWPFEELRGRVGG